MTLHAFSEGTGVRGLLLLVSETQKKTNIIQDTYIPPKHFKMKIHFLIFFLSAKARNNQIGSTVGQYCFSKSLITKFPETGLGNT